MSELATVDPGVLERSGVKVTSTSLVLPPDLSYDDFEEVGAFIGMLGDAANWWLGSWLLQGEILHGEKAAQAAEATRRSPQTCINVASVCRRVPPERRVPELSFSHHAEVASLPPSEQSNWLTLSVENNWRTHELRAQIQAEKAEENGNVLPPAVTVSVEEAARAVILASRRVVGDAYLIPAAPFLVLKDALGGWS